MQLDFINVTCQLVWRTSTPASDDDNGVTWKYQKDVTRFIPLFSKPGTFIFQLNNSAQIGHTGELTGEFNFLLQFLHDTQKNYVATLEATFASSTQSPSTPRADLIVPLTPLDKDNTGNVASVPPDFSVSPQSILVSPEKMRSSTFFRFKSHSLQTL